MVGFSLTCSLQHGFSTQRNPQLAQRAQALGSLMIPNLRPQIERAQLINRKAGKAGFTISILTVYTPVLTISLDRCIWFQKIELHGDSASL